MKIIQYYPTGLSLQIQLKAKVFFSQRNRPNPFNKQFRKILQPSHAVFLISVCSLALQNSSRRNPNLLNNPRCPSSKTQFNKKMRKKFKIWSQMFNESRLSYSRPSSCLMPKNRCIRTRRLSMWWKSANWKIFRRQKTKYQAKSTD